MHRPGRLAGRSHRMVIYCPNVAAPETMRQNNPELARMSRRHLLNGFPTRSPANASDFGHLIKHPARSGPCQAIALSVQVVRRL